ncbi:uncharacterized protein F4807DRAFT_54023 [Annulohypoxylon truncatum]|uniref:uncharacterized protein n=1 Tax=Annulohypoxylon truncatum TaxID=327061 RepID=UPI0020073673|nr:uncharacterized protein F4807DRAFT_54023 [Annulohypoxylon truncatum]KAI1210630.1 hypothetical protein F4807DRAFT_54023 [Annulohypoxylon truncatum]
MAPPTESSASAPTSKGANPAPEFTVNMNRIQTQLEARLKAARPFLSSLSDSRTPKSNPDSGGGSFSALSSSGPQPTTSRSSHPQSQSRSTAAEAAARRAAAEAEFAEDRNLDPKVGIGVVRSSSGNSDTNGKDRNTAQLRGRLLGKRGKGGNEGAEKRWVRREDSSDEEAGRSGLGRVKRNGNGNGNGNERGKRSRAEMEEDDREEEIVESTTPEVKALDGEDVSEKIDQASDTKGDAENVTPKSTEQVGPSTSVERNSRKRRKRQKKKLNREINKA